MNIERRLWQHQIEDRSESQLSDAIASNNWVIERLRHDYGEDFVVRPFEKGNPTGHDFYIQLKGTNDIGQYRGSGEWLSYPVELKNLSQWYSYTVPVIFIIWDIINKVGYWLHIQPIVRMKIESNPTWLENIKHAKEPTRKIRIPTSQVITENNFESIKLLIETEWRKIELGTKHFEILYKAKSDPNDDLKNTDLPQIIRNELRITELNALLISNPNNAINWLDLASLYFEIGNMSEALRAINKAWSLDQTNRNILQTRACILAEFAYKNGKPTSMLHEAINLFKIVRSDSNDPMADYNIGNCYSELGQFQEAVVCYDNALKIESEPHQAAMIWTNRGNANDELGDAQDAAISFENAIKLDPSLWNAHASWAALDVRHNNFKDANKHFRDAFICNSELKTSGDNIVYWFAYVLNETGEFEESLSLINHLLMVNPIHEYGLNFKAYLLSKLRKINKRYNDDALAFFRNRLLDDPANLQIRIELHRIYIDQGMVEEHQSLLEETVSYEGAPAILLFEYAKILENDGKLNQAIAFLERAGKQELTDRVLYHTIFHTLALLNQNTDHYDEAIIYYEKALKDESDPLPILEKMSDCYHFLGEYESCIVVITRALMFDANVELWWNNLRFALHVLKIKPDLYTNYLRQKIINGEDFLEDEIRAKLNTLM